MLYTYLGKYCFMSVCVSFIPGAQQVVLVVKNPPANAGDRRRRFDPWVGQIPWRRAWQPTPVFLPGESQGQGSPVGCRLWGRTESDMTEVTQLYLQVFEPHTSALKCLFHIVIFSIPRSPFLLHRPHVPMSQSLLVVHFEHSVNQYQQLFDPQKNSFNRIMASQSIVYQ